MPPVGCYNILVFTSNDLVEKTGASQLALLSCIETIQHFPAGLINLMVLNSLTKRFEWHDLPSAMKEVAEMRTYGLSKKEDVYEIYGVSKDQGLIAVVRPDGYIGIITPLVGAASVKDYFSSCLISL
mgnify:CR=1 FL=1|tara:strand:+ start:8530 stop:8910 length:381 start_codon:yes stop_codon:yes gene_type:complete